MDEALISSGRFADAVQSLLEWLNKSEAYLAEEQPILGDLDTVTSLIEQHKVKYRLVNLLLFPNSIFIILILHTYILLCLYTCIMLVRMDVLGIA